MLSKGSASGVERVGLELPKAPLARSIISRIPWSLWLAFVLVAYVSLKYRSSRRNVSRQPRKSFKATQKNLPRRRATALDSPRRFTSPQSSRRGSFTRGPRGPLNDSFTSSQYGSRAGSPFRPSFSSSRIASLARDGANTPVSSTGGQSRHTNLFGPEMTERSASLPYSPSMPSIIRGRAGSGFLPRSTSSYSINRDDSPAPRHRFTESYTPPVPSAPSRKRRELENDSVAGSSLRSGKRSRVTNEDDGEYTAIERDDDEAEDSDDVAMELDEMVELAQQDQRGTKRGSRTQSGPAKRTRRQEPPADEEDEETADMDAKEDEEFSTRKRTRAPRASDDSLVEESVDDKKARKDRFVKGGSKRLLEDVDTPTEEENAFVYGEGHLTPSRNADSEVEEASGSDENGERRRENRSSHRSKRARSIEGRQGSEEDSLMGDDDYGTHTSVETSRSPEPTASVSTENRGGKRRSVLSQERRSRPAPPQKSSSKTLRKPGEEWVNLEGDRCRMDEDGKQRKLCEVRELRRKYKMPKDSIHPDAKVMHDVVVEQWVTPEEYHQLYSQGKLAWQTNEEEDANKSLSESKTGTSTAKKNGASATKPKGIYFATGTRTPLRTHSALASRPSSANASPASTSQSPTYTTLLNGRLRLPSGAPSSPARSWSTSKAKTLGEDVERARAERDRRRKASILLGGEEDIVEAPTKTATPSPPALLVVSAPSSSAQIATPDAKEEKSKPSFSFNSSKASAAPITPSSGLILPTTTPSFFAQSNTKQGEESKPAAMAVKPAAHDFFSDAGKIASTGLSNEPKKEPTTALISFGAPPASQTHSLKPVSVAAPAKPNFSFGAAPANPSGSNEMSSKESKPPAPAAPLSFGPTPSGTATQEAARVAAPAPFSFGTGAPSPASSIPPLAPASTFSFGAAPQLAQEPKPAATSAVSSPFSFATAPPSSTPAPSSGGFSFGAVPSSTAPANAPTAPKPSFSFGAAAPGNSTSSPAPPAPSFSFGNTASAPTAPYSGFNFAAPVPAQSATASAMNSAPAPNQGFAFGQTPIVFGSSTPGATTPNAQSPGIAAGAFSFGNLNADPGAAPRRRIAGRRPNAGR